MFRHLEKKVEKMVRPLERKAEKMVRFNGPSLRHRVVVGIMISEKYIRAQNMRMFLL